MNGAAGDKREAKPGIARIKLVRGLVSIRVFFFFLREHPGIFA